MAASSLNVITLSGRVIVEPEMRETKLSKEKCCAFTLDVINLVRVRGKVEEEHSKIICEAWNALGELSQKYIQMGTMVIVVGYIFEDRWEDLNYNRIRSQVKVRAKEIKLPERGGTKEEQTFIVQTSPGTLADPHEHP